MPASADLMEAFAALDEAQNRYREARDYYEGPLPERFVTESIRRLVVGDRIGRYRFRFAKIPVNVMANRTQISSISSGDETLDKRIQEIREANDMEIQETYIHNRMYVYGDAYLMVWPVEPSDLLPAEDGESTDAPVEDAVRKVGIEMSYHSPLSTRAMYDGEDGRRVRFVIRRWQETSALGDVWYAELWYTDRLERWRTKPGSKGSDKQEWEPYALLADGTEVAATEDGDWPERHDWGIPIKHARTGLPYGRPEHADAYGPQDAVTKAVVTQMEADIEAHGWPERYRIADDAQTLDTARDAVRWDDDKNAPDASPENISARRRGPGRESVYYGTKAVGEYTPPDPGDLIQPMEQWIRMMSTITETPLYEFDPRIGGDMSGRARDKADAPLRSKEKQRKSYLLRFWREVWDLVLRMDGIANPPTIDINWIPPEVISDPDWWTTAQIRSALGVPTEQILQEANYLPDDVEKWMDDQGEEATLDQRIARLAALGDALQRIGAGAALLGLESEAGPMISRILGEAGGKELPANWTPPEPEPTPAPEGQEEPNGSQPAPAGNTGGRQG